MKSLADVEGVTMLTVPKMMTPVWHLFVSQNERMDKLQKHLYLQEVDTGIHYPSPIPIHLSKAYADMFVNNTKLENTEMMAGKMLSLPMAPYLQDREVVQVCNVMRKSFAKS